MQYLHVTLPNDQEVTIRIEDREQFDFQFRKGDVMTVTVYNAERDVWQVGCALNPREVQGVVETDDPNPGAPDEEVKEGETN